ncbi:unnamed protein product, partial [Urochloa humidicola]
RSPPLSLVPAPASWPPRAAPLSLSASSRSGRSAATGSPPRLPTLRAAFSTPSVAVAPCPASSQDPDAPGFSPVAEPLLLTPPIPSSPKPLLLAAPPSPVVEHEHGQCFRFRVRCNGPNSQSEYSIGSSRLAASLYQYYGAQKQLKLKLCL